MAINCRCSSMQFGCVPAIKTNHFIQGPRLLTGNKLEGSNFSLFSPEGEV